MEMNLLAIDLQYSPQPPQAQLLAACAHWFVSHVHPIWQPASVTKL